MLKIILSILLLTSLISSVLGSDYSHIDPDHIVPKPALTKALTFFDKHLENIPNKNFMIIVDFLQHNSKERLYLIDMQTGFVEKYLVAHGKNSDPNFTGFATRFSNTIDSKMSSLGFYLTGETYDGSHGYSLRLDGLSSTNSNARQRDIVVHGADYVTPGAKIGRSFGCFALEQRFFQEIINLVKDGALLFASF